MGHGPDAASPGVWPTRPDALEAEQLRLAATTPEPWAPPPRRLRVGGCWVTFPRGLSGPGAPGDPAWAAAVVMSGRRRIDDIVRTGAADAAYAPGLLALRVGRLMESALRDLTERPEVGLVDATGRDHPRRAGLALHLGAILDLPTVGVTHRPLLAGGDWPEGEGERAPLWLDGERVGYWLRTRPGARPVAVHAAWRTDPDAAVELVRRVSAGHRTPEPLRRARRLARQARVAAEG